jgi:serine/threonine kinase 32
MEELTDRYELLFGKRPFRGRTNTALTNAILHEHLTWPEDVADKCSTSGMQCIRAVSLIQLLMKHGEES